MPSFHAPYPSYAASHIVVWVATGPDKVHRVFLIWARRVTVPASAICQAQGPGPRLGDSGRSSSPPSPTLPAPHLKQSSRQLFSPCPSLPSVPGKGWIKKKGLSKCEAGMFQSLLTARDNALDVTLDGWVVDADGGVSLHPGYPVFHSTYIINIPVSRALNKAMKGKRLKRLKERGEELGPAWPSEIRQWVPTRIYGVAPALATRPSLVHPVSRIM
ncbi:hypothetical protein LA080_009077 [Diaporthe eres]|nr:hypothetical protein LA080_009077 [Diaporthe eres]